MAILFFSQNTSFYIKKKNKVEKLILAVIRKEKKKPGYLHFILCNDKFLLSLNKKFLRHNTLTDILTFPAHAGRGTKAQRPAGVSGEIFISIQRVRENAKKYKVTFENELLRVMIHGTLHLCGYKDKTKNEKKEMKTLETVYLKNL